MEHDNKKLEGMLECLMRDEALESPSTDFTTKVMEQVYILETTSVTTYRPLISKRAWLMILLVFTSVVIYVMFNGSSTESQWLANLEVPNFELNLFESLKFQFSKTLSYAVIFLAIMAGIQMTVLKLYFDRRLSL
jgi:hypothetical protein